MKKRALASLSLALALLLSACSGDGQAAEAQQPEPDAAESVTDSHPAASDSSDAAAADGGVLIAYFSMPEDVDPAGGRAEVNHHLVNNKEEIR